MITSRAFWRDVAERNIRQMLQVAVPLLAATIDWRALLVAMASVVVLTTLKIIAGVAAPADAPRWQQIVDRAGSAAAVTALSFIPVDGLDVTSVAWGPVFFVSACSAALAVITFLATPPRHARLRGDSE